MRKVSVILLLILTSFFFLSCKAAHSSFHNYKSDVFSLEIPTAWQKLEEGDLAEFRSHYEEEGRKLYEQYHSAGDNDTKVPFLCVLHGPNREAMLTLVRTKIPPQAGNYLEQMLTQSKETIKWGIQQGMVKQSLASDLVKIGGRDALHTDLEMANGSRLIGYVLFLPEYPYQALSAIFLIEAGKFAKYRGELEYITSTIKITMERQVNLKGYPCTLSAEAQRYLMVSGESTYPASSRVLIVNEPHYDSEGQWNLHKGLEVLINDNPTLASHLVFLAEGITANQPLSVAPLLKEVANPSDELIKTVLNSYFVTGYVTYEWRHRKGIQIVGTEDDELYKESVARWISMDKIWPLTVVARNERIAKTLLEQWKGRKLPILFVGGMHLNSIDDREFEEAKQGLRENSNPVIVKKLTEMKNTGVLDLLEKQRIGYIHLEPVSKLLFAEHQGPSEHYANLFRAQRADSYDEYSNDFLQASASSFIDKTYGAKSKPDGVTVRSVPKEAAKLSRKMEKIINFINRYCGPDFFGQDPPEVRINKEGNIIFLAKDFKNKLMFHIKKFTPEKVPHVQVEDHKKQTTRYLFLDDDFSELELPFRPSMKGQSSSPNSSDRSSSIVRRAFSH